jgi:hypothetical protein
MFVSVALAFLAATSGSASAEAAASVPTSARATPAKEKKICRVDDAVIGSMTPRRTCKTKAEWDAMAGRTSGSDKAPNQQARSSAGGTSSD